MNYFFNVFVIVFVAVVIVVFFIPGFSNISVSIIMRENQINVNERLIAPAR